jgi:mRNA interferase RelE/StbE
VERYEVEVAPKVWDSLKRVPQRIVEQIVKRMDALGEDPRPANCEKMQGMADTYRVRQGDFRIVYTISDVIRVVRVVRIGNRRDVYRRR